MQALAPQVPLTLPQPASPGGRAALRLAYEAVRARSEMLTHGLSAEDQALQSMPDASPIKWHLAHTAWFFETVVLLAHQPGYRALDERYLFLFNSYYEALGPRHPRPQRGLLSRPTLGEVWRYRRHVDAAMQRFIEQASEAEWRAAEPLITLGLNHEQQHQELMLTDLLHAFSLNPLQPALLPGHAAAAVPSELRWWAHPGGIVAIGHGGTGFAFDNETPRHEVLLAPHALASRPVNCGEYLAFVQDGGYRRAALWLSDGWAQVQAQGWQAPAYWCGDEDDGDGDSRFEVYGLRGLQPLDPAEPVCHLNFYEAMAYAQWAGARLPTEFEWEAAVAATGDAGAALGVGQVWEWTRSSYDPYPGFRPLDGAVAEYNGKFMVGQLVLRGGSRATPPGHARTGYRNFFPPGARWQFSGLRLAKDAA